MSLSVKWIKEEHPFLPSEKLTLSMSFHPVNRNYHGIFTRYNLWNFDILCTLKYKILWNCAILVTHLHSLILKVHIAFSNKIQHLWVRCPFNWDPVFLMTCSLLKKWWIKSQSSRHNLFGVLSFKYTGEQLDHPVWPNFLTLVPSCQLSNS